MISLSFQVPFYLWSQKPRKEEIDSAEEMKEFGIQDASLKKPSCGNDIEPLSKALLPATDAGGINDTDTSGVGPFINKDVSPQTGANDADSSGAGPSTSKNWMRRLSNIWRS